MQSRGTPHLVHGGLPGPVAPIRPSSGPNQRLAPKYEQPKHRDQSVALSWRAPQAHRHEPLPRMLAAAAPTNWARRSRSDPMPDSFWCASRITDSSLTRTKSPGTLDNSCLVCSHTRSTAESAANSLQVRRSSCARRTSSTRLSRPEGVSQDASASAPGPSAGAVSRTLVRSIAACGASRLSENVRSRALVSSTVRCLHSSRVVASSAISPINRSRSFGSSASFPTPAQACWSGIPIARTRSHRS